MITPLIRILPRECTVKYTPRTAVFKGKGDQSQEIARFAKLYATYFYLDPLVL